MADVPTDPCTENATEVHIRRCVNGGWVEGWASSEELDGNGFSLRADGGQSDVSVFANLFYSCIADLRLSFEQACKAIEVVADAKKKCGGCKEAK